MTNPYPLSEPIDIAVDQATEDVYVTDSGHHRVEKFGPQGAFILMFGLEVNKTAVEASRPVSEQNVCPAAGTSRRRVPVGDERRISRRL